MTEYILKNLDPKLVWSIFEDITKIYRPSKNEERIRKWIKNWAKENNIKTIKEDKIGNILLSIDASPDCKNCSKLILQAHMDMVYQKKPNNKINFENDPISIKRNGNIVTAEGTTLGADNGIGIAIALAALIDDDLKHGPLEVLLTVDEETGLTGAFGIESGFFSGKYLMNLDSEEVGKITISSAGGGRTDINMPIEYEEKINHICIKLAISGLQGGHSGVDIDLPRLNAIKIGIDAFTNILDKIIIAELTAGSAHNAIPRDFFCEFLVEKNNENSVIQYLKQWKKSTLSIAKKSEPEISIDISKGKLTKGIGIEKTNLLLNILFDIKHGPISYSRKIDGLVQTSNNLAQVITRRNMISILVSTRSSVNEELDNARNELKVISEKYGAKVILNKAYPGWVLDTNSPFLKITKNIYEEIFGKPIKLKAIHAGLECGLFAALDPELQIVSIGPNIKNAHSPDEFVEIDTVKVIYSVVKKVIEKMAQLT